LLATLKVKFCAGCLTLALGHECFRGPSETGCLAMQQLRAENKAGCAASLLALKSRSRLQLSKTMQLTPTTGSCSDSQEGGGRNWTAEVY
jgi:hypothetical protein